MKTEDFVFLRRKELLPYLFAFLISITFSQIALELSFLQNSTLSPFLAFNNPFLESIGIFLPYILLLIIFLKRRSTEKIDFSWLPPRKYILFLTLFLISLVPMIFLYNVMTPEVVPTNTTTTTTFPETTTSLSTTTTTTSNVPFTTRTSQINLDFLFEFRNLFILLILFLPLIFLFHRRTYVNDKKVEDVTEEKEEPQKSKFEIRSILECYYQASNKLEERGADDAPTLTPSEFNIDVLNKKLSQPKTITQLTDLFEEARFSSHIITTKQVTQAKDLASDIIERSDTLIKSDKDSFSSKEERNTSDVRKIKEDEE